MSEEKKVCGKDNPCQDCQKRQQELLSQTENWEINKKGKLEKFEFIDSEWCPNKNPDNPSKVRYSGDYTYSSSFENCPSCKATIKITKSNSYGDKTEELKDHAPNCQVEADHQIKSNQIKSNQIKSNQIKSNQTSSKSLDNSSKTNYLPYILGGIGLVSLVGVLVYFLTKNKNNE